MKKLPIPIAAAAVWLAATPLAVFAAVPPATGEGGRTGADFSAATQAIARHDDHRAATDLRQAAAASLDDAGDWIGGHAKAAAHDAATGADAVGDKLASGGHWAREEVARGFDSLGRGLDDLGRAVGVHGKARPVPVGG